MNLKVSQVIIISILLLSSFMIINNEWDAVFAWWLANILILPGLLLALKSKFFSLKTICLISFITQFVTVPTLFLTRDNFKWASTSSFGFTAMECLPIFFKVGVFLLILVMWFHILSRVSFFSISVRNNSMFDGNPQTEKFIDKYLKKSKHPDAYALLILLIIVLLIPINIWMFSKGISLTGVEAPHLPYKLSGILHYSTHYLIPMLLGYLYSKTRHGHFISMLMYGYGTFLGVSQISRSALVMIMLPVLVITYFNKKWIAFSLYTVFVGIGYFLITFAREVIGISVNGYNAANTDIGVINLISEAGNYIKWFEPALYLNFLGILGRVESFDNLVMANHYDPNAVDSAFDFVLRMIWRGLAPIDVDAHHIQWQGNVLLQGTYNGGALLSNMLIVSNDNLFWIVVYAFIVAAILLILEKNLQYLSKVYHFFPGIEIVLISFLSMIFFIETGGSESFVYPFIVVLVVKWLSRKKHDFSPNLLD